MKTSASGSQQNLEETVKIIKKWKLDVIHSHTEFGVYCVCKNIHVRRFPRMVPCGVRLGPQEREPGGRN